MIFKIMLLALLLLSSGVGSVFAQPSHPGKVSFAPGLSSDVVKIDPEELSQFMDQLVTSRMQKYAIPSLAVSVVQDGQIIFAQGYGYADIGKTVPVDASKTLFRIGSVSKLFVWTALMQLVEENQLDLNADVNTYLGDFQIPDTFAQPITLAHLLTHTTGFDKKDTRSMAMDIEQALTPNEYIRREVPQRVYPPGQLHIYSNYGTNLAAYILEQVTGVPFDGYLEENIFGPLGMDRSTSRQALPPGMAGDLAAGYYWQTGFPAGEAGKFEILYASGGITSTAMDMARFMLAHLGNGAIESEPILQKETMDLMHATQFRFDPRLAGYTYGFFETYRNGQRLIFHNGGTLQFSASLTLIPGQNIGLFEAYTGGKKGSGFLNGDFVDHYFPPANVEVSRPLSFPSPEMRSFGGSYRSLQMSQANFEKTIKLLDSGYKVLASADGGLIFKGTRWNRIEPLTFQKEGSSDLLVFRTEDSKLDGDIQYLFTDNEIYSKLDWYETQMFQLGLLAACLLIFLLAGFTCPIVFLFKKKIVAPPGANLRLGIWTSWFVCLVNLTFITFVAIRLPKALFLGFTPLQEMLFLLPWLSLLLCVTTIVLIMIHRSSGKSLQPLSLPVKMYVVLITASEIVFTGWLNYWNLLGFRD